MHPDVVTLAARHQLTPEAAAAVDALVSRSLPDLSSMPTVVGEPPATASATAELGLDPAQRYVDLGPIGAGGMGEVRRVHDRVLDRTLAMKRVHPSRLPAAGALEAFLEEARMTAGLQHPNIVPIHNLGRMPDGRVWFTMREIHGRTLAAAIADVHAASTGGRWQASPSGWTLRRLVTAFLSVCNAVSYAHDLGVVHRDLKPSNVMLGERGEVTVLDWGLALHLDGVTTDDEGGGRIAGTPAYMAPEQARGQLERVGARSDVYALGATLYELLAGRPPYEGEVNAVLVQVRAAPPRSLRGDGLVTFRLDDVLAGIDTSLGGPPLPGELVEACERAMARDPEDRFATAADLAEAIRAWLDGDRRREQALTVTRQALEGVEASAELRARAAQKQRDGDAWLADLDGCRSEQDKAPGWAMQDEAAALRLAAELMELEVDQGLTGALRIVSDLPEAHAALAERHRARHSLAEAARDADTVARAERLVQTHADALPEGDPVRQACAAYLQGDGALTLVTDPPGAEVTLYRYQLRHRRWIEVPVRTLGRTPLRSVSLPMGRYVCVLEHPACDPVRYPVEITRQGHWDCVAPGAAGPTPVRLPPRGTLGPDAVWMPAGWFQSGGDPDALNSHPPRRLWCDGLIVQRFPVTNRQYLAFLDDLVALGRTDEALRHAPRERPGVAGEQGSLVVGFDGTRFSLQVDAQGDTWLPDFPVFQIDWHGARAYLQWCSGRSGHAWRLPGQLEWEKAARGVDGRWFPWGDTLDPSWCCMGDSHREHPLPVVVGSFPVDVSPYGVRGVAGNVRDWCLDLFDAAGVDDAGRALPPDAAPDAPARAHRVLKGGDWFGTARFARAAYRFGAEPSFRYPGLGFRGVRPL